MRNGELIKPLNLLFSFLFNKLINNCLLDRWHDIASFLEILRSVWVVMEDWLSEMAQVSSEKGWNVCGLFNLDILFNFFFNLFDGGAGNKIKSVELLSGNLLVWKYEFLSGDQFFSSLWDKEMESFAQKLKVPAIHFSSLLNKRWCVVGNGPALFVLFVRILKILNVASIKLVASWSLNFNILEKLILINVILF